ncbi:MAG TPA: hypothetical protein VEY51_10650, partial [Chondromyces sp.]|nr:hypothetical protein [Chondromyces sp.]
MRHDYPAVILDLSANGIGIAQSLSKKGIRVYAFDTKKKFLIGKTRYAHCAPCPDPVLEEMELLEFLMKKGKQLKKRTILYAGSDEFVYFISKNRHELSKYYRFLLPEHSLIEAVLDKRLTSELAEKYGVASPKTFIVDTIQSLEKVIPQLNFPCILKPIHGHEYRKSLNKKAIVIEDENQLLEEYPFYSQFGELLIQELIPGEEQLIYQVGTFFNKNMELKGLFMGQKLNQFPPYFGAGARVVSKIDHEVVKKGVELLRDLELTGISVAEFKRDPRDGELKFIEINARTWLWHSLSEACGIDLSYLYYLEMTGQHPKPRLKQEEGITWVYLVRDFLSVWEKRQEGHYSIRQWLKTLRGKKVYALFSLYDPMPFFRSALSHVKNHWKNKRKLTKL